MDWGLILWWLGLGLLVAMSFGLGYSVGRPKQFKPPSRPNLRVTIIPRDEASGVIFRIRAHFAATITQDRGPVEPTIIQHDSDWPPGVNAFGHRPGEKCVEVTAGRFAGVNCGECYPEQRPTPPDLIPPRPPPTE